MLNYYFSSDLIIAMVPGNRNLLTNIINITAQTCALQAQMYNTVPFWYALFPSICEWFPFADLSNLWYIMSYGYTSHNFVALMKNCSDWHFARENWLIIDAAEEKI